MKNKLLVISLYTLMACFVDVPVLAQDFATSSAVLDSNPILIMGQDVNSAIDNGSTLLIFAAGTPFSGIYPTMEIIVKDRIVATVTDVRADALQVVSKP